MRNAPNGRPWPIAPELTDDNGRLEVLTFPRHVQPVLSRRCAPCHEKEGKGPKLGDTTLGRSGWFASYDALRPYAFWHSYRGEDFSRSTAGRVGARGSKLLAHLDHKHHGVTLTAGERRVLSLWLDCMSPFYGWDKDTEAQRRGETVVPRIQFDPNNPLALDRPAALGSESAPRGTAGTGALHEGPR